MAIEKVYFNISTAENNANDVGAWLLENAPEYVDDFVVDDEGKWKRIRLYFGGFEYLNYTYAESSDGGSHTLNLFSQNGVSLIDGLYDAKVEKVRFAYKTSCGIFLYFNSTHVIMLTKTNEGSIAVYIRWQIGYRGSSGTITNICRMLDVENSASAYTEYIPNIVLSRDRTVLVPMFFNGGTSSPDMLIMPCTQHKESVGTIIANNVKYVTDGYVALKE